MYPYGYVRSEAQRAQHQRSERSMEGPPTRPAGDPYPVQPPPSPLDEGESRRRFSEVASLTAPNHFPSTIPLLLAACLSEPGWPCEGPCSRRGHDLFSCEEGDSPRPLESLGRNGRKGRACCFRGATLDMATSGTFKLHFVDSKERLLSYLPEALEVSIDSFSGANGQEAATVARRFFLGSIQGLMDDEKVVLRGLC